VEVPDPAGLLADEPRRVPAGIGDMAGIEAETHPFGICIGEEAADLLTGLDVALGVRGVTACLGPEHGGDVVGGTVPVGEEVACGRLTPASRATSSRRSPFTRRLPPP
jgi:hypothetical protein